MPKQPICLRVDRYLHMMHIRKRHDDQSVTSFRDLTPWSDICAHWRYLSVQLTRIPTARCTQSCENYEFHKSPQSTINIPEITLMIHIEPREDSDGGERVVEDIFIKESAET